MEELDVIERVNASEWVSPIAVVKKKDGGIRLCVDLRGPIKAVIADSWRRKVSSVDKPTP